MTGFLAAGCLKLRRYPSLNHWLVTWPTGHNFQRPISLVEKACSNNTEGGLHSGVLRAMFCSLGILPYRAVICEEEKALGCVAPASRLQPRPRFAAISMSLISHILDILHRCSSPRLSQSACHCYKILFCRKRRMSRLPVNCSQALLHPGPSLNAATHHFWGGVYSKSIHGTENSHLSSLFCLCRALIKRCSWGSKSAGAASISKWRANDSG